MALGFQRQGIFGRKPMFPQDDILSNGPYGTPGFGDSWMQRQAEMQPINSNADAMPIGLKEITKKPGFFGQGGVGRAIAGTIGDFLLQQSGMDPIYMPNVLRQRDAEERARMAQQQRMQKREDLQWEWQNKPKDSAPYRWKANDGSLMEVGPDGQPGIVYKDPNKRLEYRQGPDGRFYPIDTADTPLPTFTEDDWNNAGGSVGNGAGGFR